MRKIHSFLSLKVYKQEKQFQIVRNKLQKPVTIVTLLIRNWQITSRH